MSTTLNFADHLFAKARNLHELGREEDALHLLGRLSGLRELPSELARETQARLAEVQLERGNHSLARRHLAAALAQQPGNARYHYLLAVAHESDDDLERAAACYRRALQLAPEDTQYLCAYGLLALRIGRREEGLKRLRRAAKLTPDSRDTLESVVSGLCLAGCTGEARALLRAALFRNPGDAGMRGLWNDFQYQQLHKEQETARHTDAAQESADEPELLPFLRPASETVSPLAAGKRVRVDQGAVLPGPHAPARLRFPGRRRAQ